MKGLLDVMQSLAITNIANDIDWQLMEYYEKTGQELQAREIFESLSAYQNQYDNLHHWLRCELEDLNLIEKPEPEPTKETVAWLKWDLKRQLDRELTEADNLWAEMAGQDEDFWRYIDLQKQRVVHVWQKPNDDLPF